MRTFEEKLAEALRKDREGRGLKNSEITLVRAYQSGRVAASDQKPRTRLSEGDSRTGMTVGRDTLYREDSEAEAPPAGYTEGAAVEVVGSDGKLVKVVQHSSWTTPTAYPTILKTENGGVTAKLDGDGIQVFNANYLIEMNPAGAAVVFRKQSGPYSITFDLSALLRDLAIRVDDYCDAGVDKSQTHIASAPHV